MSESDLRMHDRIARFSAVAGSFRRGGTTLALFAALATAGCATPPPADDPDALEAFRDANDVLEPLNRATFAFNGFLDRVALRPAAFVYKETIPPMLRVNVDSFLQNLKSPLTLGNDVLQGEFERAGVTLTRFFMNTSIGMLGIADVADAFGFPAHQEDFGQTLASWGVESGPYLVLPFLGPSNPRDGVGRIVDLLVDPVGDQTTEDLRLGTGLLGAVDFRARHYGELDDLRKNSLDFYSAVRSLYRQQRAKEIRNRGPYQPPRPGPVVPVLRERIE